jgi:hypothetical protein
MHNCSFLRKASFEFLLAPTGFLCPLDDVVVVVFVVVLDD